MAAVEVVQEPGHEVAAAVRASGRLEAGRLASSVPPRHVRRRVSRRPRNGVLVMAHEPLTRSGGPRYVKEHRGVLVVALQSVAFGASPRCVPAGEAV